MAVHVYVIGERLKNRIETLIDQLETDTAIATADKPVVCFVKRILGRGRQEEIFEISDQSIKIQPLIADPQGGTSDREDIAYRFLVGMGLGTYTPDIESDWPVATWEQAIRQRFQQGRIGVTGLTNGCEIGTTVKPGKLPDRVRLKDDIDSTILEIAVWIRESRRDDQ